MSTLPKRTPKTIRAQIFRAESDNPFRPSVIWYADDVPALSWSEAGGLVPARRRSPRARAIIAACFSPRHTTPRVERRPEVLRQLLAALEQWSPEAARTDSRIGGVWR